MLQLVSLGTFPHLCLALYCSTMQLVFSSLVDTQTFAELLGQRLEKGVVFELCGDVGSGKTAFTKGLAKGLGVTDDVQSPSFTISRTYKARNGLELHHYDFYRLADPGIVTYELAESLAADDVITVIEWAETVKGVLPDDRYILTFTYGEQETERRVELTPETKVVGEAYATWHKD